jgi:ABC-type transport system involved in multi-copper enzyme maturation permease subunit
MLRELKSIAWRTLAYALVLEAMLAGAILFWPNFKDNIGALKAMMPMKVMKEMVDSLGQGGVVAYVNGQHFFKGCNTLGCAAAVLFAMGAVAGEAQRGTLEIWLARPLSRRRMLLSRYSAGALAVALPVLATTLTIPWLLARVEESVQATPLFLCAVHEALFLLAIYSATFFFSSVGHRPTLIAFAMLFFTTLEFSMYLIQSITHWSIFRLADIETFGRIFSRAALDWRMCVPFAAISALALCGALYAFERRVP